MLASIDRSLVCVAARRARGYHSSGHTMPNHGDDSLDSDAKPPSSGSGTIVPPYARPRASFLAPLLLLGAALAILLVLYVLNTRERRLPEMTGAVTRSPVEVVTEPKAKTSPDPAAAAREREVLDIYFRQIVPQLDRSLQRKREAADRAVAQLQRRLDGHRHGIPRFADDVTSWGTRFGVLGRMSKDAWRKWWKNDRNAAAARAYVHAKFRAHVMSERDLEAALQASVQQFASDLEADRNTLFADIRLPLQTSGAQLRIADERWEQLQRQILARGGAIAESGATDSVVSGVASFAASFAGEEAARLAVRNILARVAPVIAARLATGSLAATGGAMAGGAGGGGATGSLGGPAGTVIGVGVGLAVGAVIDWWMTDRFKHKLDEQCNHFIDQVRDLLVTGGKGQPGLRAVLDEAVRVSDDAQRKAILEVLLQDVGGDARAATTLPASAATTK